MAIGSGGGVVKVGETGGASVAVGEAGGATAAALVSALVVGCGRGAGAAFFLLNIRLIIVWRVC